MAGAKNDAAAARAQKTSAGGGDVMAGVEVPGCVCVCVCVYIYIYIYTIYIYMSVPYGWVYGGLHQTRVYVVTRPYGCFVLLVPLDPHGSKLSH